MALAGMIGVVAALGVVGAIRGPRKGKEPAATAIVVTAPDLGPATNPDPPATIATPATPATSTPVPVATPVSPMIEAGPRSDPKTNIAPAAPAKEPAPARPLVVRRRQMLGQEALRRQLADLPEITISHQTEAALLAAHGIAPIPHQAHHHAHATRRPAGQAGFLAPALRGPTPRVPSAPARSEDDGEPDMRIAHRRDNSLATLALLKRRQPELGPLPWRMGEECHLPRESAEELEVRSRSLRDQISAAIPVGDTRPDADWLRASLLDPAPATGRPRSGQPLARTDVPRAIPALMQLLMAERTPARLVLIEVLSRIEGAAASKALARLAIFDLDPDVREQALIALRDRPAGDYRPGLLEGLRYPWAPVADHAAEALVALEDRDAIPALVELLDEPDPEQSRTEVRKGQPVTYTRSLVQVNHLRNCLLCHAPSANPTTDLVRGRVPTEGMPLPPPREYYAATSPGAFVRAEVTYLRQDFSATQPVEQSGPWPGFQRYDYLVAERPVPAHRPAEPKQKATFPQRESALYALRELVGEDHGEDSAAWKAATQAKPPRE